MLNYSVTRRRAPIVFGWTAREDNNRPSGMDPADQCAASAPNFSKWRWLEYKAADLEDDFVRFRQQGRGPFVVFFVGVLVLYGVAAIVLPDFVVGVPIPYTIALLVVSCANLAALVTFVLCAKTDTAGQQISVAKRLEALSTLPLIVVAWLTIIATLIGAAQACASGRAGRSHRCYLFTYNIVVIWMVVINLLFRPRVKFGVPMLLSFIAVFLGATLWVGLYEPIDYAAATVMLLGFATAVAAEAVAHETNQRRHYEDDVEMRTAKRQTEAAMQSTEAILNAALPKQLRGLADSAEPHHSDTAVLGMCDIHDFAQWSCGLLVLDVVVALHEVLTHVDVATEALHLVPAMAYGDCCVVCANLVDTPDDAVVLVTHFARFLIDSMMERAPVIHMRGVVCVGPLSGRVAGGAVKRYVVSGAALATATMRLPCVPSLQIEVVRCAAEHATPADAARTPPNALSAASAASPAHDTDATADADVGYSAVLCRFTDDPVQKDFQQFVAVQDATSTHLTALIPLAVFAGFIGAVLLERASPDVRRHHSAPLPLAMITVAPGAFGGVLAVRLRATQPHYAVTYGATAAALLVGCVGLLLLGCGFAAPRLSVLYLLALPPLFPRLPWLLQWLTQLAVVLAPVAAYIVANGVMFGDLFAAFLIFTFVKYAAARTAVLQFLTARNAATCVVDAVNRAARNDEMLRGLIPPHAMPAATVGEVGAVPTYYQNWRSLSVAAVAVTLPAAADPWTVIADAMDVAGGEALETVRFSGDAFTIAGVFLPASLRGEQRDVECRQATLTVVAVLRRLVAVVGQHGGRFTAVAATGDACSALLGASLLTFRLFGPVVRECDALLAAAPAAPHSVAFAADSFRKQFNNFGVATHAALCADAAMSVAVTNPHRVAPDKPTPSETATFSPAQQWRVRGVGVAAVSEIDVRLPVQYSSADE
jgi:hypothetical protein